jgi:23S rRNA (cytidine1920-2'-O)/16S rRNA (cytidine1409-2'-O)-methyltransferase
MRRDEHCKRTQRLDLRMVELGLAPSRARARDLILRGLVEVGGAVARKPGGQVAESTSIAVAGAGPAQVSRGALKLAAALEHFQFAASGVVALDVGASTGGFTEVLLSAGAARVYAVDVGRGQLDSRLGRDERFFSMEGCDARRLDRLLIPEPIGAVVVDVSFISLTKALPAALALVKSGGWLVALVKPQFEAGRAAVGKGGIVRDADARQRAVETVRTWISAQPGWRVLDVIPSPITGGSGNQEFLLGAIRDR